MKLQERSLTPLYRQVMDDIRHKILTGGYRPNERIPSEPELSEIYSVSRITIRRAVEELVAEGYLTKQQGKGTFVNSARVERKTLTLSDSQSFLARCEESGLAYGAHVVELCVVRGSEGDCQRLGLQAGSELLFVRRTLLAGGQPVMVESLLMPLSRFARLAEVVLEDAPIAQLCESACGVSLDHGSDRAIEVVRASTEQATLLAVSAGEPLFLVSGVVCDRHDTVQMLVQLHIPTTFCSFAL